MTDIEKMIADLEEPRLGIHDDGTEELKTWEQLYEQGCRAAAFLKDCPEWDCKLTIKSDTVINGVLIGAGTVLYIARKPSPYDPLPDTKEETMYYTSHYVIDWDKVKDLEDVKRILMALNFAFEPNCPTLPLVQDCVRLEAKAGHKISVASPSGDEQP